MIRSKIQKALYNKLVRHGFLTLHDFEYYYSTKHKAVEQLNHFIKMGFLFSTNEEGEYIYSGKTLEDFEDEFE